ncbi:MAG: hypothetical protein IJY24_06040 [Clostridia bacterium]|nr:hypothetical protein [Clostridia bacterium]
MRCGLLLVGWACSVGYPTRTVEDAGPYNVWLAFGVAWLALVVWLGCAKVLKCFVG